MIPSPSLRCAACAAAGAGVHTTVYIKPPPAPAGRDAAKGIQKKRKKKNVHATVYTTNQIVYILPYTIPHELCTHYPIHREADCVHATVYKKKGIKKEAKKRQARVYTNERCVRLREQAERGQARVYKNKKSCTPLVVELTAEHTLGYT